MGKVVISAAKAWVESNSLPLTTFQKEFYRYLIMREGCRLDVYKDSKGYPTVGLGHKVEPSDRLPLGSVISMQKANEFFLSDYKRLKIDYFTSRAQWWGLPQKLAVASFIWAHGYGDWQGKETERLCMNPKTTQETLQSWVKNNWDKNSSVNRARNAADMRLFHVFGEKDGLKYYASLLNGANFYYFPDLNKTYFNFDMAKNDIAAYNVQKGNNKEILANRRNNALPILAGIALLAIIGK